MTTPTNKKEILWYIRYVLGTQQDFDAIDENICLLGVKVQYREAENRRIYRMRPTEIKKLPVDPDKGTHYLPINENEGWGLIPLYTKDPYLKELRFPEWGPWKGIITIQHCQNCVNSAGKECLILGKLNRKELITCLQAGYRSLLSPKLPLSEDTNNRGYKITRKPPCP